LRDIRKVVALRRATPAKKAKTPAELFTTLFVGGYPRIHDKRLKPRTWLANYYQTYVERDVRDLLNVGDIEIFGRFVRLCAGRSGQLLNASSLAADVGVSHATIRRWLAILEASFVIYLLRPHHRNFNKRLVKSPKLYFLDTGLLCYLLRIRSAEELVTHAARGAVFETWVISEALKGYFNGGVEPDIYFWRDSAGHEIDLLIDQGATQLPVEIKSGQTVAGDFFRGLDYWRQLADKPSGPAALVYGGDASYKRRGTSVLAWSDWM
jgi:predicted AAA+ superfamily ATPase